MDELAELYQEVILDHNRHPRNFGARDDASHTAEGYNPLCGDRLTVYLNLDGDVIRNVSFHGSGCAISRASASVMTTYLKGKSGQEARALFEQFHAMVTGENSNEVDILELGDMAALSGVCRFPIRVKCATLAWHTMRAALGKNSDPVTTE